MNLIKWKLNPQRNKKILYGFFYFFLTQPLLIWISALLAISGTNNIELNLIFFMILYFSGQVISVFLYSYCHWLFRKTNQKYYWKYSWFLLPWNSLLDFVFFYKVIMIYRLINKLGFREEKINSVDQNLFFHQGLITFAFIVIILTLYLPFAISGLYEILNTILFFSSLHIFIKIIINQIMDLIMLKEQLILKTYQKITLVFSTILGQFWFALLIKKQTFKKVGVSKIDEETYYPSWYKKKDD